VTEGSKPLKKVAYSYKAPISSGASRLDPKEIWAEKFTNDNENLSKRLDALEKGLNVMIKLTKDVGQAQSQAQAQDSLEDNNIKESKGVDTSSSNNPIAGIREELKSNLEAEFVSSNNQPAPNNLQNPKTVIKNPIMQMQLKKRFRSKGIQRTSLNLINNKINKALKTYDNFIPAGAFAGAVMVGGVDASTSISASSDPRPVLLRITHEGTLPRHFKSDLCGCHVLAACYGDISSERVFMRLEKLTCTERKTGEIMEMNIQGYVAGEDGRAGLRGVIVDRAGPIMRNAAIGGFLSGMGNFLSQSSNPTTFSAITGIGETNPMTNPQMLKHGAAKGASTALEKYADFYIKRAEQMQPIIQVQAGRYVDIVFTQGVAMEDSAARGAMVKIKDQQRLAQVNSPVSEPIETFTSNTDNQTNSN
jgi:conjugal transfer pilus assembly protein TraB